VEEGYFGVARRARQGGFLPRYRMPDRLGTGGSRGEKKGPAKKVRPRSDAATDGDRWGA